MTTGELKESIHNDELEGKQDMIYWTKALILEIRELKKAIKELEIDL